MLNRWVEEGLLDLLESEGVGCIAFSPLARGLLTDRYLAGIPADSRAAGPSVFLKPEDITEAVRARLRRLNDIASARGQSLAQMALAWVLRSGRVTSVLIGASRPSQIDDCAGVVRSPGFTRGGAGEDRRGPGGLSDSRLAARTALARLALADTTPDTALRAVCLAHVRGFAGDSEHTHFENCPFLLGFLKMALQGNSKV